MTLFSLAAGGVFNGQSLGIAVNSVMALFHLTFFFKRIFHVVKRELTAAFKYIPEVTLVMAAGLAQSV